MVSRKYFWQRVSVISSFLCWTAWNRTSSQDKWSEYVIRTSYQVYYIPNDFKLDYLLPQFNTFWVPIVSHSQYNILIISHFIDPNIPYQLSLPFKRLLLIVCYFIHYIFINFLFISFQIMFHFDFQICKNSSFFPFFRIFLNKSVGSLLVMFFLLFLFI